jgi:uncharacterized membrane protein
VSSFFFVAYQSVRAAVAGEYQRHPELASLSGHVSRNGKRCPRPGPRLNIAKYSDDVPGLDTRPSLNNKFWRSLMNLKTIAIASAVGSLLALGSASVSAEDAAKEKCLGVADAGKNDCANGVHSCAGQAKTAKDSKEWKYVPKGECEKMGGKIAAADKKAM